jgi:hypothetical protein
MVYIGIPGHRYSSGANVNDVAEDIHWQQYANRFRTFQRLIEEEPLTPPQMIICIPSYAEPDLINTLESLQACQDPHVAIEVIILFNQDDRMDAEQQSIHLQSFVSCKEWISERNHLKIQFHPVWLEKMEGVKWGVGWARKMLMDEAARRMTPNGIIVNLDADCAVADNYLQIIQMEFADDIRMEAASIYTEHVLEHLHHSDREAIIAYELHLRYLVQAKRWAGHPFAYQTYGSAMAVRRNAYLEQGGMNTRQAGEDFYFLQKFIEIGTLREIRDTVVYPSSRKSLRVPFGTGKAMYQIHEEHLEWKTTSFESFRLIRPLFQQIPLLHKILLKHDDQRGQDTLFEQLGLASEVINFLQSIDFKMKCDSIATHTSNLASFERRFFRYFNAFMMIRYMHYMRDHGYPDTSIAEAVEKLVSAYEWIQPIHRNNESYLNLFRMVDRNGIASIHLFG